MTKQVEILKDPKAVIGFLDKIVAATDANRKAFGFNSRGAYEQCIKRAKIWVATNSKGDYLGHLMFGGKPPQSMRIFQVYVSPAARGTGTGQALIDEIVRHAEDLSCLYLRADVANDLNDAIKFWEAQGFCAVSKRKKDDPDDRPVLIYERPLSTPSLLPNIEAPLEISFSGNISADRSYLIDLNIFQSLARQQDEEKLVAEIIKASLAGEFSLFCSPELKKELERHKKDNDTLLLLVDQTLPVIEAIQEAKVEQLQRELRPIVFPTRSEKRKKAENDVSDLRHLAYCILSHKSGFVTQEKAILRVSKALFGKYGIEVLSPEDFKIEIFGNIDPDLINVTIKTSKHSLSIQDKPNQRDVKAFLDDCGIDQKDVIKPSGRGVSDCKAIVSNGKICGVYFAQTVGTKHDGLEGVFIASSDLQSKDDVVFQHILQSFLLLAQGMPLSRIAFRIQENALGHEKICIGRGFQRSPDKVRGFICLAKMPAPILITQSNWRDFRDSFASVTGRELTSKLPTPRKNSLGEEVIKAVIKGQAHDFPVQMLETFISPSLILFPKREAVIIPIVPAYASNLLNRADDLLPFPQDEEALLRTEKVYYLYPTRAKYFASGTPIVFYESGNKGRGAIGCARVVKSEVVTVDNAEKLYRKYGVLDKTSLAGFADRQGRIQVVLFDNFKPFAKYVPYKKLTELGCAKANLVAPEKIDVNALSEIVHLGFDKPNRDALISIQPEYVTKILSGQKTIELRKKPFPHAETDRLWIYTTTPTAAIEGVARVAEVIKGTPDEIWQKYSGKCGIQKSDFDKYFEGADDAYAIRLKEVVRLKRKLKLADIQATIEGFVPPQYFRYLEHKSTLFETLMGIKES